MQRITTATRQQDKFGPGRDGFTDGNPTTGTPSTQLEAGWFDHLQEEVARAIELSGIPLNGSNVEQLFAAINARVAAGVGALPLPFVRLAGDTMSGQLTVVAGGDFSASAAATFEVRAIGGSDAVLAFHAPGVPAATKIGLNQLNQLVVGGWTWPGARLVLDSLGNLSVSGNLRGQGSVNADNAVQAGGDLIAGANCTVQGRYFGNGMDLGTATANMGTCNASTVNCSFTVNATAVSVERGVIYRAWAGATEIGFAWTGAVMNMYVNGGGVGTTNAPVSDARLKHVRGAYPYGLRELLATKPVLFNFRDNTGPPRRAASEPPLFDPAVVHVGIVAQEQERIIPEMIQRSDGWVDGELVDDMRFADDRWLLYATINAIKELDGAVQHLAAQVDALHRARQ